MLFCDSDLWVAIQVVPRHESKVASILGWRNCIHFLPTYRTRQRWSDRVKVIERPLFPGYIFCRSTQSLMQIVRSTPGIIRLITRGGKPCPVALEEIAALQRVMEANRDVCVSPYLRVGQRAEIISGPLMGVVGIIVRFKHGDRLVLSVDLIMKSVAVEIDSSELAPLPIQPQANRTLFQTPCRNTA